MSAVTFAAYGDSLSLPAAWPATASDGVEASCVGGVAIGGARSYVVAASVTAPVVADVTTVMVGTNDISNPMWAVQLNQSLSAVTQIIVQSGAAVALVAAIPPRNDGFHVEAAAFNTALRNFAVDMGWFFIDPWTSLRTADNKYRPTFSVDGIHPTAHGYAIVGHWMRIIAAARPGANG